MITNGVDDDCTKKISNAEVKTHGLTPTLGVSCVEPHTHGTRELYIIHARFGCELQRYHIRCGCDCVLHRIQFEYDVRF